MIRWIKSGPNGILMVKKGLRLNMSLEEIIISAREMVAGVFGLIMEITNWCNHIAMVNQKANGVNGLKAV